MNKSIIFISLILLAAKLTCNGQYISQDIDGFSTLIVPTASFNYSVSEEVLNFNLVTQASKSNGQKDLIFFHCLSIADSIDRKNCLDSEQNNFNKKWKNKEDKIRNRNTSTIYGASFNGKSVSGISNIYTDGTFNANTKTSVIFGKTWEMVKLKPENFKYLKEANKKELAVKKAHKELLKTFFNLRKVGVIDSCQLLAINYAFEGNLKDSPNIAKAIENYKIEYLDISLKLNKEKNEDWDREKEKYNSAIDTLIKKLKNVNDQSSLMSFQQAWKILNIGCINLNGFDKESNANFKNTLTNLKKQGSYADAKHALQQVLINLSFFEYRLKEYKNETRNLVAKRQIAQYQYHSFLFVPNLRNSSFSYDSTNNASILENRIVDTSFNSLGLDLIYNLQWNKDNRIGLGVGYNYLNTQNLLKTGEYTFSQTDTTIGNGKLSSSKTVKALSGNLRHYHQWAFNFDYIHYWKLKKNPNDPLSNGGGYLVGLNPYFRTRLNLNEKETVSNNTVLGIGLTIFNTNDNKFMGGAFVQTNDLFSKYDKTLDVYDKKFQVGFVFRFGIKGFDESAE